MNRTRAFLIVAAGCLLVIIAAVTSAVLQAGPGEASAGATTALAKADRPMVVFRSLGGATRDQVGIAPADAAGGKATFAGMQCDRVYFSAGSGLCVARGGGFASGYRARIFGSDLRVRHELDLDGTPSRARVSATGRSAR